MELAAVLAGVCMLRDVDDAIRGAVVVLANAAAMVAMSAALQFRRGQVDCSDAEWYFKPRAKTHTLRGRCNALPPKRCFPALGISQASFRQLIITPVLQIKGRTHSHSPLHPQTTLITSD